MLQRFATGLLALLLLAAGIAWWRTSPPSPRALERRAAAVTSAALVDESIYATAQRLARLAVTAEDQARAQTALRVADHELALAFTAALRDAEAHPPVLGPEAVEIRTRLMKSQALLDADQQRTAQLTAALAQAKNAQRDALQDELELAKSQSELDQDELEEANHDLVAAGGNPQQRIQTLLQEHDAQVKSRAASAASAAASMTATGPAAERGSWRQVRDWLRLRRERQELAAARDAAAQKAETLTEQRAALAADLDNAKGSISELAQHTRHAKTASVANAAGVPPPTPTPTPLAAGSAPPSHTHADAAALLDRTKLITADQKLLTLLDRQIADLKQLAGVYQQWNGAWTAQSVALLHRLMLDTTLVIGILLATVLLDKWAQRLLDNPKLDRRQVETLRSLTRVSVRVIAVLLIILIVIGVPGQFGTMVGIVGAGLTVALKDFIVAFFGWLMLMRRNGIRLGDWVEINGVSGEVTELGMFHTVMLETGNWSNAGHPTGRRVTFTNSFAIEGHYFNFSTTGQWLWDELQVVVPMGQDPYPIVEAITQQVTEATAESARLAEQEWQRAVPNERARTFSGTPGVNIKPVVGGVEISVRYITRAYERFALRAKLYQAAVDLLGQKTPTAGRE